MDSFTEKLLERTQKRREDLQRKLAGVNSQGSSRVPLDENINSASSARPNATGKGEFTGTASSPLAGSRGRATENDENEDYARVKRSPGNKGWTRSPGGRDRRGRFAQLAREISSWEDDSAHPMDARGVTVLPSPGESPPTDDDEHEDSDHNDDDDDDDDHVPVPVRREEEAQPAPKEPIKPISMSNLQHTAAALTRQMSGSPLTGRNFNKVPSPYSSPSHVNSPAKDKVTTKIKSTLSAFGFQQIEEHDEQMPSKPPRTYVTSPSQFTKKAVSTKAVRAPKPPLPEEKATSSSGAASTRSNTGTSECKNGSPRSEVVVEHLSVRNNIKLFEKQLEEEKKPLDESSSVADKVKKFQTNTKKLGVKKTLTKRSLTPKKARPSKDAEEDIVSSARKMFSPGRAPPIKSPLRSNPVCSPKRDATTTPASTRAHVTTRTPASAFPPAPPLPPASMRTPALACPPVPPIPTVSSPKQGNCIIETQSLGSVRNRIGAYAKSLARDLASPMQKFLPEQQLMKVIREQVESNMSEPPKPPVTHYQVKPTKSTPTKSGPPASPLKRPVDKSPAKPSYAGQGRGNRVVSEIACSVDDEALGGPGPLSPSIGPPCKKRFSSPEERRQTSSSNEDSDAADNESSDEEDVQSSSAGGSEDDVGDLLDEAMETDFTPSDSHSSTKIMKSSKRTPVKATPKSPAREAARQREEPAIVYSIDQYRAEKGGKRQEPVNYKTIVRETEHQKEAASTSTVQSPTEFVNSEERRRAIRKRIKELKDAISQDENIIIQASAALNQCCGYGSQFVGSAEQVECNRVLLVSCQKRQAYLTELNRLESSGPYADVDSHDLEPCRGSLTVSDIRLPLKEQFLSKLGAWNDGRVYYFICLVRYGAQVLQTHMLSTHEGMSNGSLAFSNRMVINNLRSDFKVIIDIYGMEVQMGSLGDHKSKHTPKSKLLTPKKLFSRKISAGVTHPSMTSPGGPYAVRSTNFIHIDTVEITNKDLCKDRFKLKLSSASIPLAGTLYVKLQCHPHSNVEEKGFLTMFEDVSGFGAWHRRWCVLSNWTLCYWKYPDDSGKQAPMGRVELEQCMTDQVKLLTREVCARPNTFELVTAKPKGNHDEETLVSRSLDGILTTKHWLSADTKEDRVAWCNKLNQALTNLRMWNPNALRPFKQIAKQV